MTDTTKPIGATTRAMNGTIRWLADRGVSVAGAQTLTVRGRASGREHRIPVNPLTVDGHGEFLVAPRGVTDWVRNVRVTPAATLRRGRRIRAIELSEQPNDEIKVEVLAAYLSTWGWEVGALLPAGISADADLPTLRANAERIPVFAVH